MESSVSLDSIVATGSSVLTNGTSDGIDLPPEVHAARTITAMIIRLDKV
jgi:hypothetical protein